ncbi:hypothetical protein Sste5346_002064 [Sporothrix stenoceras]|uniref:Uncharacterized protein n=1 Tax=Sporothrix stenoceras TaxID=5173 RepID=A0ABR3ZJV1_9PEZI
MPFHVGRPTMMQSMWRGFSSRVLFPLSVIIRFVIESLGHPVELARVLLGVFYSPFLNDHCEFQVNNYYNNLTRENMRADLRWALADLPWTLVHGLYNPRDGITRALSHATSRWRRWLWRDRGPLYACFNEYAVEVTDFRGRKTLVWTQDQFAAFVANRLGGGDKHYNQDNRDPGVTDILWRQFCYSAHYPFTRSLSLDSGSDLDLATAEHCQLDLADWVQAVAMLATTSVRNIEIGRARYSATGPEIWYQFFSFAKRNRSNGNDGFSAIDNNYENYDNDNNNDDDNQSVWQQVAYVASARLPLEYIMYGPHLSEILPRVRKLVSDAECVPVRRDGFAIPYQDMVCLFAAILQVQKRDLKAVRYGYGGSQNRGLGLAFSGTGMDRDLHLAIAKNILAVANVHNDLSYKQYEALWHRFALDFLYPIVAADKWEQLREERRKNTLMYSSETSEGGGLSRDAIVQALTGSYVSKLVVIYGRTTGSNSQPALFTVSMSSPLWRHFLTGAVDDHYVDEKHVLMELAPEARVLQFSPAKAKAPKSKRLTFLDLVGIDESADSISFGQQPSSSSSSGSGLFLDLATGVAHLTSAPHLQGHYVEIPAGSGTKTPDPVASPIAWTTSMTITKLEVYEAPAWGVSDLTIQRGLRRSSRLQAAEERSGQ